MLTGRKFRLLRDTLAIIEIDGERRVRTVPTGSTVKVVSGPTSDRDRMVDILWEDRVYAMFAQDVMTRGDEITDTGA